MCFSRINGSRLFTVLFLDVSAFRRGECHGEDSPFKADGKASSNVTAVLREIQNGRFNGAGTNDLQAVSMTTGFGVLTLIDSTMYMLTIFLTMGLLISWKLTFAAIIPLPIMAAAVSLYGKKIHERFTEAQDAFGSLNDKVLESVSGVRVIRAFVQEKMMSAGSVI